MSHATAKTHVSRLLTKLDARDRAQLVMIAYEAGVVVPGSMREPIRQMRRPEISLTPWCVLGPEFVAA